MPFQTIQERKVHPSLGDPVWLRTCYKPELDEAYEELVDEAELVDGYALTDNPYILDNSSLYDSGSDWMKILSKIPSLCDFISGSVSEDYDVWDEHEAGEREMSELERISCRFYTVVYVVDEEAIKEHLVKIMWLDSHGNCLWDNKMKPDGLTGMHGALSGGGSLYEMVEEGGGDVDSPIRGFILAR